MLMKGEYMKIHKDFIYLIIILSLLILISILLRNIYLKIKTEKQIGIKNKEIISSYEKIIASDEKLKENIYELTKKQKELERSKERYRIVAESTMDIIWEADLINNKRFFTGKLYDILGYKSCELEDINAWFNIIHPNDIEWVKKDIKDQIDERIDIKAFEYRVKCKDGNYKWILSNTKCEFDESGNATTVFGAFTDITKLKDQQQEINRLAYYDSLTGLPNRSMLIKMVLEEINQYDKTSSIFALIFMDLNNFKSVNDSYGHMTGDKLLICIANQLKGTPAENMIAFRLGGDEFIMLIKDLHNKSEVEIYLQYILESLSSPILIGTNMIYATHSCGIVFYPENGLSFDELIKNADTAMYKSKGSIKSTFTFYSK